MVCSVVASLFVSVLSARKFYPDDPLWKMPAPFPADGAQPRELNDFFDILMNTLGHPAERQPEKETGQPPIPGQAVNTLGEVPDSLWFTNRIGTRPMTREEIVRGPRQGNKPAMDRPLTIVRAKTEGVSPGFEVIDAAGRRFVLKFDPLDYPEMSTSADFLGSIFFHDLGYNVPENYLIHFTVDQLDIDRNTMITDDTGRERRMTDEDAARLLQRVPRDDRGRYRALASLFIQGKILGGFRLHGTRSDDPNDVVRHEHRRDLRGLYVFAAWLNHNDSRSINTLDSLVEIDGVPAIKHHLIDFGAILGSSSVMSNTAREGNTYFFEWGPAIKEFFTLGLAPPKWQRSDYVEHPSIGKIEYPRFEPDDWKSNYPQPAFLNRLPDDEFWAAKKVMAFSEDDIRAVVAEADYGDPEAADWIVKYLLNRRRRIGEVFFAKVLPLDRFEVRDGRLVFEDLEIKHGYVQSREYQVEWSLFDNQAQTHQPLSGAAGFELPPQVRDAAPSAYYAAEIRAEDPAKTVTVYLRTGSAIEVVGIDRTW